jgi:hypothetical protein
MMQTVRHRHELVDGSGDHCVRAVVDVVSSVSGKLAFFRRCGDASLPVSRE